MLRRRGLAVGLIWPQGEALPMISSCRVSGVFPFLLVGTQTLSRPTRLLASVCLVLFRGGFHGLGNIHALIRIYLQIWGNQCRSVEPSLCVSCGPSHGFWLPWAPSPTNCPVTPGRFPSPFGTLSLLRPRNSLAVSRATLRASLLSGILITLHGLLSVVLIFQGPLGRLVS